MSFSGDIKKFGKAVRDNHVKIKRIAAMDVFSSIIISTPVDKGVLRNNWFVSMGAPYAGIDEAAPESGQEVVNRTRGELSSTSEETDIFFTNNLDYAYRIEFDGWSGKAPEGMVRVNTSRWSSIVKTVTRKVASGAL